MPYIKPHLRTKIDEVIDDLSPLLLDPGDFNYAFTRLIDKNLSFIGKSYYNINNMVGMLECCKLELYRRVAGPYEDQKKEENGDAYSQGIV